MKFCYECDKSYHKMLEKDKHSRGPLKFDTVSVCKELLTLIYDYSGSSCILFNPGTNSQM